MKYVRQIRVAVIRTWPYLYPMLLSKGAWTRLHRVFCIDRTVK